MVYQFLGNPPESLKEKVDDEMIELLEYVVDSVDWDERAELVSGALKLLKVDAPYNVDGTLSEEQDFYILWTQTLAHEIGVNDVDGAIKFARQRLEDHYSKPFFTGFIQSKISRIGFDATHALGLKHLGEAELIDCYLEAMESSFDSSIASLESKLAVFQWLLEHDREKLLKKIVAGRGRGMYYPDSRLIFSRDFAGMILNTLRDDDSFRGLPLHEQAMICAMLDTASFETSLRFERLMASRLQKQLDDLDEEHRVLFRQSESSYYRNLGERIAQLVIQNKVRRAERIVNAIASEAGRHYCRRIMLQQHFDDAFANRQLEHVNKIS